MKFLVLYKFYFILSEGSILLRYFKFAMKVKFCKISFVILLFATVWSCATTSGGQEQPEESKNSNLEDKYWATVNSKRNSYTQADVNFMIGMIAHHSQAIIMSRLAPTHGASKQVQKLAARIINTQKGEINRMQLWLKRRNEPVPKVKINGLQMMITLPGEHRSMHHKHMNMPGMLSQKQLKRLANAYGAEFNRLFLNYMIQHHSGALFMVEKLVNTPGAAQGTMTYHLASGIQGSQRTEIARMKRMLKQLPDAKKTTFTQT